MHKNSLILLLSFILGLSLVSCNNFLKADEVKSEIENQIAYANAPSYKIVFNYESESGQLRKPFSGELNQKVSDVFEI